MKLKLHFILLTALAFILGSCAPSERNEKSIADVVLNANSLITNKVYSLTAKQVGVNSNDIGRVMTMQFIANELVISDLPREYLFKVYNTDGKLLFKLCKLGEGPNEFKFPTLLQSYTKNGKTMVKAYNSSKGSCSEFEWTQTLLTKQANLNPASTIKFDQRVQRLVYLPNSGEMLAVGLFSNRYSVLNTTGQSVQSFGEYPFRKEFPKVSSENLAMAFQGNFTITESGQKAAFATSSSSNIDFIDASSTKFLITKQHHLTKPDFQSSNNPNEFSAAILPSNKMGFLDIQSDKKYVYVLYSGKNLEEGFPEAMKSKTIVVFDWAGALVAKLELDISISKFAINTTQNKIYAFVDLPTPEIVYFNLPKKM